ncbi:MAG: Crp/Fnr family transcriptional regulator, partial [Chitinophagaceae bacterium]|nr:Crp/Fnr family transcriptional regulator [Chitinophagaceae bacterium]
EPAKVCFIANDFLESTLQTNPSFTNGFLHFYSDELQRSERRLRDLVHMNVRGRVALALLEIAEFFGTAPDKFIAVPIMRQDIASYAGTTYETVFKLMTDFTQNKIITTDGKRIRILKPGALKAFIKK